MSMGAKASRDRAEGSPVVMIVLGGGKRETYSRPVSAQEVMLRHPQHVLTYLDVLRSDVRKAIVTPETVLLPGNKYFLVLHRTVEWALDHHVDLATTWNRLSAGTSRTRCTSRTSDSATEPTPIEINLHHGLASTPLQGRQIIASSQHPQAIVEHKPQITLTDEQLHPARRRNPRGKTAKSPLHSISRSEHTQRPRRSSPKVCPGEDASVCDEQISDTASNIQSSADTVKEMTWNLESVIDVERLCPSPLEDVCSPELIDQKREKVCQPVETVKEMTWNLQSVIDVERLCPSPHEDVCLPELIDQKREKVCQPSEVSLPGDLTGRVLQLLLLSEDQTSDGSKEKPSQDAPFDTSSTLLLSANGSVSMQLDCLSKQETPACNLVLEQPHDINVANRVNIVSKREVDLPVYRRSLSLQESVEDPQNMPLFELLKCPDVNVGKLLEDKPQCRLTRAPRVDVEVHDANEQNTLDLPVVERIEVHDHICVMFAEDERSTIDHASARKDMVSCLDRDDVQHKQSQSNIFTELYSHADMIDKPQHMVHGYLIDKEFVGSPLKENIQVQLLGLKTATCDSEGASSFQQREEDGNISESLLPSVKSIELQSFIQDQQKEGCASMPNEISCDQQTSNLTLPFHVGGCKEPGQLYSCGVEEEITKLDCQTTHDSKAIDVDNSSDKTLSENLNTQQMASVGNMFLLRFPNHTGLIDFGVGKDGKNFCGTSGVPSVSSPSLLPLSSSSLSLSSSLSFSSSPSLSRASSSSWSSLVATTAAASSSSVVLSSSSSAAAAPPPPPPSLSLLMRIDRSETMTTGFGPSRQVKNGANKQQNLAMLGFSSLRSDSLSLFKQAKAHIRATLLTPGNLLKIASSKTSPLVERDRGHYHRPMQQRVERQTGWAFAMGSPQPPPIYHYRPYSRIKISRLLKKPHTKPLSPILEFSPELSPASLSPLSICPS